FRNLDFVHPRHRRTHVHPREQFVDMVVRALQQGLDGAIVQVAHPSGYACRVSLSDRGKTETDALHLARNTYKQGFDFVLQKKFLHDPSASSSVQMCARSTAGAWPRRWRFSAVSMIPTLLNACGKLPSIRPCVGSYCSERSPTS